MTFAGEVHPYADRWPMRPADEIEAMAASVAENGLRFPIVLSADGVLVDGRNRLRACELAGVEPRFEVRDELADEDAVVAFIWDANGDRRDMSKGAKAMMAALMEGSALLRSSNIGVSRAYVDRARQVIQWCDHLVDKVIADELSLNDAYAQAQQVKATEQAEEIERKKREKAQREQAERQARLLADLREHRPDLADLVDQDKLPVDDALDLRRRDAEKARRDEQLAQEKRRKLNADFSVHVVTLAGLGEYPDRVSDLLDRWDTDLQVVPVTADLIDNAIRGLTAVAGHLQGART